MVQIIKYQEIKNLTSLEAVTFLLNKNKYPFNELESNDLLKENIFGRKFVDQYYNWLFIRGIYLFFTSENEVIYIGKAKDGFYGRLMGHISTEFKANFGWNAILRKMGGKRLNVIHNDLNTKEHEIDLKKLLQHKLILIDVGYYGIDSLNNCLTKHQIGWLESILLRAFDYENGKELLNSGFSKLIKRKDEMNNNIKDLLRLSTLDLFLFVADKYQIMDVFSEEYLDRMSFYSFNQDSITLISGEKKPDYEMNAKRQLHPNLYGIYSCGVRVPSDTPNAVLLGIRDSLLPMADESPSELCEMIALHEICHYIDWQNLKDILSISFSDCDKAIGEKLENLILIEADKQGIYDNDHNKDFGAILYNLIRRKYPVDAANKMNIALSKTLYETETSYWVC